MRIEELLAEQQLDELGWKNGTPTNDDGTPLPKSGIAQGVNKVAGGIGKAVGGVAGAWQAAKQGYQTGKAAVSGQGSNTPTQPNAPAGQGSNVTTGNQTTQGDTQTVGTTKTVGQTQTTPQPNIATAPSAPAGQEPAPPANTAQADQQAKVGVGQINKIIPGLRTRDLQSLKKTIDQRMQALNKTPNPTGQQPQAQGNQTVTAANTVANAPAGQQSNVGKFSGQPANVTQGNPLAMAESAEFYSKFLGKNI